MQKPRASSQSPGGPEAWPRPNPSLREPAASLPTPKGPVASWGYRLQGPSGAGGTIRTFFPPEPGRPLFFPQGLGHKGNSGEGADGTAGQRGPSRRVLGSCLDGTAWVEVGEAATQSPPTCPQPGPKAKDPAGSPRARRLPSLGPWPGPGAGVCSPGLLVPSRPPGPVPASQDGWAPQPRARIRGGEATVLLSGSLRLGSGSGSVPAGRPLPLAGPARSRWAPGCTGATGPGVRGPHGGRGRPARAGPLAARWAPPGSCSGPGASKQQLPRSLQAPASAPAPQVPYPLPSAPCPCPLRAQRPAEESGAGRTGYRPPL